MIKNKNCSIDSEKFENDISFTPQEGFVTEVYASVDKAAECELDRLRKKGIRLPCKPGCCHCCRYNILTNIAEAHILEQYIKREFSENQINNLQMRTQQWHEWDNSRPGRHPSSTKIDKQTGFSNNYEHPCPLLVDNKCSAYPARPVVCRTHFVCSPSLSCCAANDPESTEDTLEILKSIITAADPFSMLLRNHIENAGLDFSRSILLLPQWLAIKMGWDFSL